MKQVFITGKEQVEIRDVPDPSAFKDWALVKIYAAPLCTEYKQFASGQVNFPLGHEAAGEVVEVAQPGHVKVGDRVVVMPQYPCGKCNLCNSGEYIHCRSSLSLKEFIGSEYGDSTYAEYILKPSWLLPVIPEDISYNHGSMLCCGLGPAFGAMERMGVGPFDTVLITGMGPVGLGGVINALYRNGRVIAVSGTPYRAKLASELGAHHVIKPDKEAKDRILDLTGGRGVTAAIDCSGEAAMQNLIIKTTARNGRVGFVGESGNIDIHVSDDLIRNGLTLYGIWHYNYTGINKLFDLVRFEKSKIDKLITHRFTMDEVGQAWRLQLSRKCAKVLLVQES